MFSVNVIDKENAFKNKLLLLSIECISNNMFVNETLFESALCRMSDILNP